MPRALEEVYTGLGYQRPVPFKPRLSGWNVQLVGQLADQSQRCLTQMETILKAKKFEAKKISEDLTEVKGMIKQIHEKAGIAQTTPIGDTPVRPKNFLTAVSNGECSVEGNKMGRKLLPLAMKTQKGTFAIVVKDEDNEAEAHF